MACYPQSRRKCHTNHGWGLHHMCRRRRSLILSQERENKQRTLKLPGSRLRNVTLTDCFSHVQKSTYRLITTLAVYENGLGLSQDNPLCLLFILPCSLNDSQRFQTHVLYRSIKWLMGALLKHSRLVYGTGD